MSYSDKKWTRIESGAAQDMGNGTPTVFSFKGPTGKKGTIVDVGIEVTETFACDSTEASFQVGTTGDADAYCKLTLRMEPQQLIHSISKTIRMLLLMRLCLPILRSSVLQL